MGQDKALLRMPGTSGPLWQEQWRRLDALDAEELFWSGPPRNCMPDNGHVVLDTTPGAGPLAGISACLDFLRSDLLIVLAVDLPQMTSDFLRGLLARCEPEVGCVSRRGDFYEPLAAVYPRQLRSLAHLHLAQKRYAMQDFIRAAVEAESLRSFPVAEKDETLFKNLNAPSDLSS